MNEYQIEIRVKNALILRKIKERGYSSINSFCDAHGVSKSAIGEIINFKACALNKKGQIREFVVKFCEKLDCLPEDIFTSTQLTLEMESNVRALEVNETELQMQLDNLTPKLLEDERASDELAVKLSESLGLLTPREQRVLTMRFGLEGESQTFGEIGAHFGVHRERIRQIEAKALRKLRHPSRSGDLRDFVE